MNILVFGGTRFFGVYLVETLLKEGHEVTVATRGMTKDSFGDRVKRLCIDRVSESGLAGIFAEREYDCVVDNICYASKDVKKLLDVAKCKRYVMTSTMSVYQENIWGADMKEEDFDPVSYPLAWYDRGEDTYDETKRQAEAALFQVYSDKNAAAVRFPFVIGETDYTKRLYFYVEHVIKQEPVYIDNLDEEMSFICAKEAGSFLAWLSQSKETGTFNAANKETVTIRQILKYVEEKSGKRAILQEDGDSAPYNGTKAYSLNTKKAENAGFVFTDINSFLPELLDKYIEQICSN